ncbi:hypothetical protein KAI04_02060 [Candidatus Pacearchaeota archaeon]|nr:hypothetical protein [Candidatus Pacearchaeota archaeon]
MKKVISKKEAKEQIKKFFEDLKNKSPKDIKKIKKLAMSYKIPLKENRKLFCKCCLNPHKDPSIRVKKGLIKINCGECDYTSRWKIK